MRKGNEQSFSRSVGSVKVPGYTETVERLMTLVVPEVERMRARVVWREKPRPKRKRA